MIRPASITSFERLYLGSLVVWTVNLFLAWPIQKATLLSNPAMARNPAMLAMVDPMLIGGIIVVAAASLLFWFLIVRQASVAGKWLVVVTEALGALFAVFGLLALVSGRSPSPLSTLLSLVATGLAVAAAVMLFRPDATAWFDGRGRATMPVKPYP